MKHPKFFILYDGRARDGSTDDATVLDTADSEQEAREIGEDEYPDAIWFQYDDINGTLVNPVIRPDLCEVKR